jgi:hypothetical protein
LTDRQFATISLLSTRAFSFPAQNSQTDGALVRISHAFLALSLTATAFAAAPANDARQTSEYLKSLPAAERPVFDQSQILALASLPLSCIDHPQQLQDHPQTYLWVYDSKAHPAQDYDRTRAFYGCYDWHSAVNSTWTLVALLRQNPKMFLAPVIRQRITEHLGKDNIAGEVNFFSYAKIDDAEGKNFERPYGYTWVFKLYGELQSWSDPDAQKLAVNMQPLVKLLSTKYVDYLKSLPYPMRVGVHPNTALTMSFALDYTDAVGDVEIKTAVHDAAVRFFGNDKSCPTAYEPSNGDFASPCLAEAMLMSRVLDQKAYITWLNDFLPPVYSPAFKVYQSEIDTTRIKAAGSNADAEDENGLLGSKSHLIGLAFQRAADLLRIASALPPDDPRVAVFQRLADLNAQQGFRKIGDAGYLGQHWLATYAVLYMQAQATAEKK